MNITNEQDYNDSMRGGDKYEMEQYQDLESRAWTAEETVDMLLQLTYQISNDMILGAAVRSEMKKFDKNYKRK